MTPSGSVGPTPPVTQTVAVPVFVTPSNNITCGAAGGTRFCVSSTTESGTFRGRRAANIGSIPRGVSNWGRPHPDVRVRTTDASQ